MTEPSTTIEILQGTFRTQGAAGGALPDATFMGWNAVEAACTSNVFSARPVASASRWLKMKPRTQRFNPTFYLKLPSFLEIDSG
ncbi:MAG TPA: hypothetical protein VK641_07495 [Terriglobales bacterium]|nr:hypothetical protein [Terriglobales bacterium]